MVEEYNALLIIRIIKQHSNSDKLFIHDIKDLVDGDRMVRSGESRQGFTPVHSPTPDRGGSYTSLDNQLERSPFCYGKNTYELPHLESELSLLSRSNIITNPNLSLLEPPRPEQLSSSKAKDHSILLNELRMQEGEAPEMTYE